MGIGLVVDCIFLLMSVARDLLVGVKRTHHLDPLDRVSLGEPNPRPLVAWDLATAVSTAKCWIHE